MKDLPNIKKITNKTNENNKITFKIQLERLHTTKKNVINDDILNTPYKIIATDKSFEIEHFWKVTEPKTIEEIANRISIKTNTISAFLI